MFRDKAKDGTTRLTGGAVGGGGGDPGVGIDSIELTSSVGLVDTYTITYTDLSTSTFQVTNGSPGADSVVPGPPGDNAAYIPTFTAAGWLIAQQFSMRLYVTVACTISQVHISVGTAPAGQSIKVDVNKNGVTIFTTQANRPEIAIAGFADSSVPDVTALAPGDYLTVDIDQAGTTILGADLVVQVVTA